VQVDPVTGALTPQVILDLSPDVEVVTDLAYNTVDNILYGLVRNVLGGFNTVESLNPLDGTREFLMFFDEVSCMAYEYNGNLLVLKPDGDLYSYTLPSFAEERNVSGWPSSALAMAVDLETGNVIVSTSSGLSIYSADLNSLVDQISCPGAVVLWRHSRLLPLE
jgi:hypothetical protein